MLGVFPSAESPAMDLPLNINGYPGSHSQQGLADCTNSAEGGAYICTECGEGFGVYARLQEHMTAHGQEQLTLQYGGYIIPPPALHREYDSVFSYARPMELTLQENGTLAIVERPPQTTTQGESWGPAPQTATQRLEESTEKAVENGRVAAVGGGVGVAMVAPPRFSCEVCWRLFNTSQGLQRHQRFHTSERGFKCTVCCQSFSQRAELRAHLPAHAHLRSYGCGRCGKRFTQTEALRAHRETHGPRSGSPDRSYPCGDCGLRFFWLSDLQSHGRSHHAAAQHPLPGRKFTELFVDPRTGQIRVREWSLRCEVCAKGFSQPSDLKRHAATHAGARPFRCGLCGRRFTQASDLKRHQRVHLGRPQGLPDNADGSGMKNPPPPPPPLQQSFPCHVCGRSFFHSSSLSRHQRYHTGDKPHRCRQCGKGFVQRSDLLKHETVHAAARMREEEGGTHQDGSGWLPCPDCGKVFVQAARLKNHRLSHAHGGPRAPSYRCPHCRKGFSLLSVLRRHQRYHAKERAFRCPECPRGFRQSSDLNRHLQTHGRRRKRRRWRGEGEAETPVPPQRGEGGPEETGQVLYECPECEETFVCLQSFLQHQSCHVRSEAQ